MDFLCTGCSGSMLPFFRWQLFVFNTNSSLADSNVHWMLHALGTLTSMSYWLPNSCDVSVHDPFGILKMLENSFYQLIHRFALLSCNYYSNFYDSFHSRTDFSSHNNSQHVGTGIHMSLLSNGQIARCIPSFYCWVILLFVQFTQSIQSGCFYALTMTTTL